MTDKNTNDEAVLDALNALLVTCTETDKKRYEVSPISLNAAIERIKRLKINFEPVKELDIEADIEPVNPHHHTSHTQLKNEELTKVLKIIWNLVDKGILDKAEIEKSLENIPKEFQISESEMEKLNRNAFIKNFRKKASLESNKDMTLFFEPQDLFNLIQLKEKTKEFPGSALDRKADNLISVVMNNELLKNEYELLQRFNGFSKRPESETDLADLKDVKLLADKSNVKSGASWNALVKKNVTVHVPRLI
jgi:hypothetical protein